MRKISSLLIAAALIATASISAFADDASVINSAEKKVLDELKKSVTLSDGTTWVAGDEYYNITENYFKTVDATDEQADAVIAGVLKVKDILSKSNINDATVKEVSKEKRAALLAAGREAVAPLGLEMNYDYVEKQLVVTDKAAGETVGKAKPALTKVEEEKPTASPTDGKTTPTGATSGGNSGGSNTNSGNTNTGKTVTDNVIKTTGAGVDTSAVAGVTAAGIVVAAAGAAYAFKTRKERV